MRNVQTRHFKPTRPDVIPFELVRLDKLPPIATKPEPNRHTFHEIFWVTSGTGYHVIDFEAFPIKKNALFFVGRGQVHYLDRVKNLRGYVVLFKPDLFITNGDNNFMAQLNHFYSVGGQTVIYPDDDTAARFQAFFDLLKSESDNNRYGRSQAIISLLKLILLEFQRKIFVEGSVPNPKINAANTFITYRFLKLIEEDSDYHLQVRDYAEKLGITISHLSKSVKDVTGINAGSFLRNQSITEAKRKLIYSELTITEIAAHLQFSDPSYFSRFFKREAGLTPKAFREQYTTKYPKLPT